MPREGLLELEGAWPWELVSSNRARSTHYLCSGVPLQPKISCRSQGVVVCDIRIFISILYRYDIGVNIEISIQFSIIFNCVGGVIAWAVDIYKYA